MIDNLFTEKGFREIKLRDREVPAINMNNQNFRFVLYCCND